MSGRPEACLVEGASPVAPCSVRGPSGRGAHLGEYEVEPRGWIAVEDDNRLHQGGEGEASRGGHLGAQGHAGEEAGWRVVEGEVHGHGPGAAVDPPAGPEAG